jgi:hypothetical protein
VILINACDFMIGVLHLVSEPCRSLVPGELIRCLSEHGDFAFPFGGVAMPSGQILVLECLLPGACGHLWLCLVLPSIKWHCHSRTPALGLFARYLGYLRAWLPRA